MDTFTVSSTNFTASNQTVTLTFNSCNGTAVEYNIDPSDTSYDITSVEPFVDSVYSFHLKITTSVGNIVEESTCYFVGEDLKCDILEAYRLKDIEKVLYYQALVASNSCISCSCSDLCSLYTNLTTTTCDDLKCTTCATCH